MALVLRQIPNELLPLDVIGLDPGLVDRLLSTPRGMILVTGPTGSGKSTTLASMINIINETQDHAHIITIEDPIEFYHPHKVGITTQREVHKDVPSFAEAPSWQLLKSNFCDAGRHEAKRLQPRPRRSLRRARRPVVEPARAVGAAPTRPAEACGQ